MAVAMAEMGE